MATKPKYDDILDAEERLETLKRKYLEAQGWKHTSATPGCRWLWVKKIDGRELMLDTDYALFVQHDMNGGAS